MNKREFINLISFCILIEGGGGVINSSPLYVLQKYQNTEPGMLDSYNLGKLEAYKNRWIVDKRYFD